MFHVGAANADWTHSKLKGIMSIDFAHNHDLVATGSDDQTVRLFRVSGKGEEIKVPGMPLHGSVMSVSFSSDDSYLAVAVGRTGSPAENYNMGLINVYSVPEMRLIASIPQPAVISSIKFVKRDGNDFIVAGGWDGETKILDFRSGKVVDEMKDHDLPILAIAMSSNSKILATASGDHTVRLRNIAISSETGSELEPRAIPLFESHQCPWKARQPMPVRQAPDAPNA